MYSTKDLYSEYIDILQVNNKMTDNPINKMIGTLLGELNQWQISS